MAHDPDQRPREREGVDVERDTGTKGYQPPQGEGGTPVGPEDEELARRHLARHRASFGEMRPFLRPVYKAGRSTPLCNQRAAILSAAIELSVVQEAMEL